MKIKTVIEKCIAWSIILLGGGLLVSFIYVLCKYLYKFLYKIYTADSALIAAIIIAAITAIASVVTVTVSKIYENKQESNRQQREKKIEIYEEVIGFVYDRVLVSAITTEPEPLGDEIKKFWINGAKRISLWGDDEIVRLFSEWKNMKDGDIINFILKFEALLFAIRKNLGYKNTGLKEGDLVSFFVIDIKEKLKK